ncbi:MAG: hypothetical protein A2Z20_03370 [Bdellovibrionales bacterium RBG_16_40_8]|nr:MAG: hypothetical protein A2Z20_03370 [Bdellovibrionales bacterium RBG_16_40_8]
MLSNFDNDVVNKKIAITGANGFIGKHLVTLFKKNDWQVICLMRETNYDLAKDVDDKRLVNCKAVIHCAYTKNSTLVTDANKINYLGTLNLLQAAEAANVENFVYLSSMSAHEKATSDYGRSKLQIESLFNLNKHLVIRPGLVLGAGGFFEKIKHFIANHKLIPLIGGGYQPIQTVNVAELCAAIYELIVNKKSGLFIVAEDAGPNLRDVYVEISKYTTGKKIFFYIPAWPIKFIFKILDILHALKMIKIVEAIIKYIPFDDENLRGLEQLRAFSTKNLDNNISFKISDYKKNIANLFSAPN